MGLEGAVKLGFKNELDSEPDPQKKQALYEKLVKASYEKGKAISAASFLEFDEVIDPKDSRKWIINALDSFDFSKMKKKKNRMVDSW